MEDAYFQSLESLEKDQKLQLEGVLQKLNFNSQGLIPVITQDSTSKDVLMMAWMNREAIDKTLSSGFMTYWSRSRQSFWLKGESSGHFQSLKSMRFDCDGDALLCLVEQTGGACHTGRENCFYFEVDSKSESVVVLSSALSSAS